MLGRMKLENTPVVAVEQSRNWVRRMFEDISVTRSCRGLALHGVVDIYEGQYAHLCNAAAGVADYAFRSCLRSYRGEVISGGVFHGDRLTNGDGVSDSGVDRRDSESPHPGGFVRLPAVFSWRAES